MCGIAGFSNQTNTKNQINEKLLHAMQQSLTHRGPNDSGVWKSDQHQIGFAHRRLSIIDLSPAGRQPMMNSNQSVVVCFNGEIYNHKELRKQLESLGHTYRTETDTETLIHAYEEWGIKFLEKLDGMFAIALFDTKNQELYLIRDRIGIKPLYFSTQGGYLSFASEIKALWQLPWMKRKMSAIAHHHYLTFMVTPAPYTIFEGVYKLPAGMYAKLDAKKNLSFHEWYSPLTSISQAEKKQFNNENFCVENIRELLKVSTKKRMISDVPFGAFLSGGIDSSLNVALMAQEIGKVKTFTVAFSDGPEINELKWARKVAKQFDTDHHEIIISEKEAFEFYEKMIYHNDEPLADPVCIPFYHVAKLAKESGVTVVQVGEGSDELFFGYDLYAKYQKLYSRFWSPTQKIMPAFLRKGAYGAARKFLSNKPNYHEILHNWAHGKNLFWGGAIAFGEQEKAGDERLLNPPLVSSDLHSKSYREIRATHDPIVSKIYASLSQAYDSHNIVDYHMQALKKDAPQADTRVDFAKQIAYLELKQRLPELLLMRTDKMAMATGIEARVPFLDHKLVEFALNIPGSLKFKNNTTKYILKKACEGIIPNEIIYRKKVGFAAPIVRWLRKGKYFPKYFDSIRTKQPLVPSDLQSKSYRGIRDNKSYTSAIQEWVLKNHESHT